jgi:hypothetical protein
MRMLIRSRSGHQGTQITIPSGATLSSTDPLVFPAGTVSLPAITTTGDTNTGIFFPAADTIAFTEGGAEAMRINSSGLVLAGTTSAVNNGHTFKAIADNSLYFALSAEDATTTAGNIRCILATATGTDGASGYLFVGRNSTEDVFHVRSNGDVDNLNNSYGAISDRNLKENEVDASSADSV